jgi:creatinine amidohydrolase
MPARPYVLAEVTWPAVAAARYSVAVLPWGATEAHNRHLPYGTDIIEATSVAIEAARLAWERGAKVVVLPAVPFGVQTGQLDIPLCVNVNPTTQLALLRDVAHTLAGQGIAKLVILNSHGGNDFRWMIRELQPGLSLFLCTVNLYAVLDAKRYFAEPGEHAGEAETSMIQHLAPDLVRPLAEAGPGRARPWRVAAFNEGWAWAPRRWTQLTDDTGVGDPKAATPEKGAAYVAAVAEKLAAFFIDLTHLDPGHLHA